MASIERKIAGTETLDIEGCPCCGGEITVGDCGYSTFNPGWAKCGGTCKREWKWETVENERELGKQWNARAKEIQRRLQCSSYLKVADNCPGHLVSDAKSMLVEIERSLIGSESDKRSR
jgi:hypothetical protein